MYIKRHVPTAQLVATQPYLEEEGLAQYLEQRDAGQQLHAHARVVNGEYRLLDGHHKAVIADLIDGTIDLYVHENPNDYNPTEQGGYLVEMRWKSVERMTFGTIPEFRRNVHHWLREEQWVRSQLSIPAPSDAALEKKVA